MPLCLSHRLPSAQFPNVQNPMPRISFFSPLFFRSLKSLLLETLASRGLSVAQKARCAKSISVPEISLVGTSCFEPQALLLKTLNPPAFLFDLALLPMCFERFHRLRLHALACFGLVAAPVSPTPRILSLHKPHVNKSRGHEWISHMAAIAFD